MALFRQEAITGRGTVLEGAVSLAVPLSWQIIGALLFAAVAGGMLFLLLATTDRVARLDASVGSDGKALAVLPDAATLPERACGTLTLRGGDIAIPACVVARSAPAPHLLDGGNVIRGRALSLRLATPAPAGARGQLRFVTGRETLWAALAR